ncbi:MAG: alkaline phosphatase family protein, partial [Myxococcales bacterium]|nr:alkaline phosphatase family protein [Myxococcales bacterium]
GVFDFVHRRPETRAPFSSMAEVTPTSWTLNLGDYSIPLRGGDTVPLRKGQAFWELLTDRGVEARILRMPTDFPPLESSTAALAGMGAPDMLGTFGTFQYFTDDPDEYLRAEVSGGEVQQVTLRRGAFQAALRGPVNGMRKDAPRVEIPMRVDVERARPGHRAARIQLGDEVVVLREGEWSRWVPLEFELIPTLKSGTGIVRLYLRELAPHFKLYVSPINIDPVSPEVRVSNPSDYAAELAAAVGRFYTQGMAEETKGLSAHLLTREEFAEQAHEVFDETIAMYEHVFAGWDAGFLFYYFSTTDQAAHMLWGEHEDMLVPIYEKADAVVGWTLERLGPDDTLMVISDHGFARFDREVHLNRWLMDEGLLALDDPQNVSETPGFLHVDWSQTQVYAMGLNGLYLNRVGREREGVVTEDEIAAIEARLEQRLLALRDPETGAQVVERLYRPREYFAGDEFEFAPDYLVGFAPPYRMSSATGLGAVPAAVIEDNEDEWIGDHCMAHERVPGVLFTNRLLLDKSDGSGPRLHDIPVTVLSAYGVPPPEGMVGEPVIDFERPPR